MIITNSIVSIGMGFITYLLLYLNELQNKNNNISNNECVVSLKIPIIISLLVYLILNTHNFNNIENTIKEISQSEITANLDLFTDNVSYWF